jgi:transposase
MQYHAKAALTVTHRAFVRELAAQGVPHAELARRFGVHRRTIQRWAVRSAPTDRSSAPQQHGRKVVTDAYRAAVVAERTAHPSHGPQRIADDLRARFPTANRATVWRILRAAGLSRQQPKKTTAPSDPGRAPSRPNGYSRIASD